MGHKLQVWSELLIGFAVGFMVVLRYMWSFCVLFVLFPCFIHKDTAISVFVLGIGV